mmetsp:Transcript_1568/g.3203  ORF Transcript_1568/g.3203 Transcript_1568/m.3203 type:complete len:97 (-) Transcript_1568:1192-1482(-)
MQSSCDNNSSACDDSVCVTVVCLESSRVNVVSSVCVDPWTCDDAPKRDGFVCDDARLLLLASCVVVDPKRVTVDPKRDTVDPKRDTVDPGRVVVEP